MPHQHHATKREDNTDKTIEPTMQTMVGDAATATNLAITEQLAPSSGATMEGPNQPPMETLPLLRHRQDKLPLSL